METPCASHGSQKPLGVLVLVVMLQAPQRLCDELQHVAVLTGYFLGKLKL